MQKIGWSVVALAAIVVALALPVSASLATATPTQSIVVNGPDSGFRTTNSQFFILGPQRPDSVVW